MRGVEVLKALYRLTVESGQESTGLWEIAREASAEPYTDVENAVHLHLRKSKAWGLVKAKKVPVPRHGAKNLYSLTQNGIRRVEWHLARERASS